MINFEKHRITYNIISETLKAQQIAYTDINTSDDVQLFLDKLPSLSDKELYDKSLEVEPRGSTRADIQ